ncbi:hypothetical protein F4805DRAFT_419248 [Annulohypoxylon moriforme]|nr:hypothetical protein F4805DRAFT_419248 [Annulohypoxylon moriforme]
MSNVTSNTVPSMVLVKAQSSSPSPIATPDCVRWSLMDFPAEVRVMIHQAFFANEVENGFSSFKSSRQHRNNLALLRVCKKIHVEASPILYKKLVIDGKFLDHPLDLHLIGRNIKLIQNVTIQTACNIFNQRAQRGLQTTQLRMQAHLKTHTEWPRILHNLVRMKVNPRHIRIKEMPHRRTDVGSRYFFECQANCSMHLPTKLPKFLAENYSNVETIELTGKFDPSWGTYLHENLGGFISKRTYKYRIAGDVSTVDWVWTLVNTNHPQSTTNKCVAGYRPYHVDGIYDKLLE